MAACSSNIFSGFEYGGQCVTVASGLCLGMALCQLHACLHCGTHWTSWAHMDSTAAVDRVTFPSCLINVVIRRALDSAKIPSDFGTKEHFMIR